MKPVILLCLVAFLCVISSCVARDLIVGTSFNNRLVWQRQVEYNSIPLKKRVKEVFYSDPYNTNLIKGIIARDKDHTDASAIVTAGGVGFTYVNLRFKSDRGYGLNYAVEIYA